MMCMFAHNILTSEYILLLTVTHYLIFWPKKDLVSTVPLKSVINKNTTDALAIGASVK